MWFCCFLMPFILLNQPINPFLNVTCWCERQNWLISFIAGVCGSIMWRKASAAALLALAVGYLYYGSPELSEHILQYISPPNFPSLSQKQNSHHSLEQVISAAWETLITLPTRQWSRVAVGWVGKFNCHLNLSLHLCFCSHSLERLHVEKLQRALLLRRNVLSQVR